MKPKDEAKARDILTATLSEIAVSGLAGLSMEAVAKRAKVATGTLYIYYKNKQALIEALYLDTKRAFSSQVFHTDDLPVRAAFERSCVLFLDYLAKHKAETIFMAQVVNSPFLDESARAEGALFVKPLIDLLERGKRERLLKDIDSALMISFLHGSLRELSTAYALESKAARPAKAAQIATLCWDALKA